MLTIYKETKSVKWTVFSGLMPLSIAFILLFILNQGVQLLKLL
jgi:Fe2+ transport system protein B